MLFKLAMDVLPIQASSVSCERVFSSAKETDTLRRSCLSPLMMEVLQFLKQSYKRDLLNFTTEWLVSEDSLTSDIPSDNTFTGHARQEMHNILAANTSTGSDASSYTPRLSNALTEELTRACDGELDFSDDDSDMYFDF